jgi:hypothetical protein
MKATKWTVGQHVYMFLDQYPPWFHNNAGTVVEVAERTVAVQTDGELLRIDTNNIPALIVGQTPLTVGQEVEVVRSQGKNKSGKVVQVTPTGVEVEVSDLLLFDNNGYELDYCRRERLGFGPSPGDPFHNSLWHEAPEFGPWHLDDMHFAERTALIEQADRELRERTK